MAANAIGIRLLQVTEHQPTIRGSEPYIKVGVPLSNLHLLRMQNVLHIDLLAKGSFELIQGRSSVLLRQFHFYRTYAGLSCGICEGRNCEKIYLRAFLVILLAQLRIEEQLIPLILRACAVGRLTAWMTMFLGNHVLPLVLLY